MYFKSFLKMGHIEEHLSLGKHFHKNAEVTVIAV
jgi:hypothetical protein